MKLRRSAIFIAANRKMIKLHRSGIFWKTIEDVAPDGAWKLFWWNSTKISLLAKLALSFVARWEVNQFTFGNILF
jgi:hypothetical protein